MSSIAFSCAISDEVVEFYPFFDDSIHTLFPEYTLMTRDFIIEKDYNLKWMEKEVKKGSKILFLARDKNKFVGYLLVSKVYAGVCTANWLAVSHEAQKRGIATKLVQMWEEYALGNQAHALHLWTTSRNLDFYGKRGFTLAGTFKQAWFGLDMPMMYKSLRPAEEKNYLKKYLDGLIK